MILSIRSITVDGYVDLRVSMCRPKPAPSWLYIERPTRWSGVVNTCDTTGLESCVATAARCSLSPERSVIRGDMIGGSEKMKAIAIRSRVKKSVYEPHGNGRGAMAPYIRANARSFATPVDMFPAELAHSTGIVGLTPKCCEMVLAPFAHAYVVVYTSTSHRVGTDIIFEAGRLARSHNPLANAVHKSCDPAVLRTIARSITETIGETESAAHTLASKSPNRLLASAASSIAHIAAAPARASPTPSHCEERISFCEQNL